MIYWTVEWLHDLLEVKSVNNWSSESRQSIIGMKDEIKQAFQTEVTARTIHFLNSKMQMSLPGILQKKDFVQSSKNARITRLLEDKIEIQSASQIKFANSSDSKGIVAQKFNRKGRFEPEKCSMAFL